MRTPIATLATIVALFGAASLHAQIVVSANENKITLDTGAPIVVQNPEPDSISILDFSEFPPKVTHIMDVPNTVIGPPSNVAISPDGRWVYLANSVRIDPEDPTRFGPGGGIRFLDVSEYPPSLMQGHLQASGNEYQPSGMSLSTDGTLLLVANRATGSVSQYHIRTKEVGGHLAPRFENPNEKTQVCEPEDSASDVAISPDGKTALVSIQNKGYLAELKIDGTELTATGRHYSVYGKPYRVIITPDGELAITAGAGFGGATDLDAVSVVDLTANPPKTIQHVTTGSSPESVEISPDGQLLAVVTMDGSNLAPDHPEHTNAGGLYIYKREGKRLTLTQKLVTGRIPEGVAFTSDGRYLVVQCHPDRELRIYRVRGTNVADTDVRIPVPGYPSGIRASR